MSLNGRPEGSVASPTTSLVSDGAPKTPAVRCPVVGGVPLKTRPGGAETGREVTYRPRGIILRSAEWAPLAAFARRRAQRVEAGRKANVLATGAMREEDWEADGLPKAARGEDAAPAGGMWAQGDRRQNCSRPPYEKKVASASCSKASTAH